MLFESKSAPFSAIALVLQSAQGRFGFLTSNMLVKHILFVLFDKRLLPLEEKEILSALLLGVVQIGLKAGVDVCKVSLKWC